MYSQTKYLGLSMNQARGWGHCQVGHLGMQKDILKCRALQDGDYLGYFVYGKLASRKGYSR